MVRIAHHVQDVSATDGRSRPHRSRITGLAAGESGAMQVQHVQPGHTGRIDVAAVASDLRWSPPEAERIRPFTR